MLIRVGRGFSGKHQSVPGITKDTSAKTAAVFGDSISFANVITSGGTQRTNESVGYLTCYNALSGQRMTFEVANNQGVSGNTTADMLARRTDLAALSFDVCFVLGGTNDITAKTAASTITSNLGTIYDYLCNTLGKTVIALTILPRSYWTGFTAGEITAGKADINTVNTWIMNQNGSRGGKVIAVNLYTNFTGSTPDEPKTSATYDGLHPAPYGGMINGMDLYAALEPYFGNAAAIDFSTGNLLTNGTLSGTGGTASTNFTGSVASNFTAEGFGGTGGRTASKPSANVQRLVMGVTNGTSSDSMRLKQAITTGFAVGDTLYGLALVQISGTPARIYQNALQLRLTGTGVPTLVNCFGLDKRNAGDWLPEQYMTVTPGTYLIRTPNLPISSGSSMSFEWRYEMLGDSSSSTTTSGTVDIMGAGVFKV